GRGCRAVWPLFHRFHRLRGGRGRGGVDRRSHSSDLATGCCSYPETHRVGVSRPRMPNLAIFGYGHIRVRSMVEDQPIEAANRNCCRRDEYARRRRVVRWICVVPAAALIILIGGFFWFVLHIANEEMPLNRAADGIVALTGGASRITDAVELLASGRGRRL